MDDYDCFMMQIGQQLDFDKDENQREYSVEVEQNMSDYSNIKGEDAIKYFSKFFAPHAFTKEIPTSNPAEKFVNGQRYPCIFCNGFLIDTGAIEKSTVGFEQY